MNSMEAWTTSKRPTSKKISKAILDVANFLAEFCRLFESNPPPFLRLMMDASIFGEFNIKLVCNLTDGAGNMAANGGGPAEGAAGGEVGSPVANGVAAGQIIAANAYAVGGKKKRSGVAEIDAILSKGTPVGNGTYSLSKEVGRDTSVCYVSI